MARDVVARWATSGGAHWIDLYKDDFGYGYKHTTGGGWFGQITLDEAVRTIESRIRDFAPDTAVNPMKRIR